MLTPLDMGLALSRASVDMMSGWMRLSETMAAAHKVVEHRSGLMNDAARNPLGGDYAELNRMIPEKISAFALAGSAWMDECLALQRHLVAQVADTSRFIAGGGARPAAFLSRSAERSNRAAVAAMRAGGKALAPVHKAATGNARRLEV